MNIHSEKDLKLDAFNAICRCLNLDITDSDKEWWNQVVLFALKTFTKIPDNDHDLFMASLTDCLHSLVLNAKYEYHEQTWRTLIQYVYSLTGKIGLEKMTKELALATLAMIPFSGLLDDENLSTFTTLSNQCSSSIAFASAWQLLFTKVCNVIFPTIFQFQISIQSQHHTNPNLKNDKFFEVFMMMTKQAQQQSQPMKGIPPLRVLAFNGAFESLKNIRTDLSPIFKAKWPVDAFLILFGDGAFDQAAGADSIHFSKVVSLFADGFISRSSQWPSLFQKYVLWSFGRLDAFEIVSTLNRLFLEKPQVLVPLLPFILNKMQDMKVQSSGSMSFECLLLILNIEECIKSAAARLLGGQTFNRTRSQQDVVDGKVTLTSETVKFDNINHLYRLHSAVDSVKHHLISSGAETHVPAAVGYMMLCSGDLVGYARVLELALEYCEKADGLFLLQGAAMIPLYHPSLASYMGSIVDVIVKYFTNNPGSEMLTGGLICLLLLARLKLTPKSVYELCLAVEKTGKLDKISEHLIEQLKFALMVDPSAIYTPKNICDVEKGRKPTSFCSNHCILSFFDDALVARTIFGILVFTIEPNNEPVPEQVGNSLDVDENPFVKYVERRYPSLFDDKMKFLYDFGILNSENIANFRRICSGETVIEAYDRLPNMDVVDVAFFDLKNNSRGIFERHKLSKNCKLFISDLCDSSIDSGSAIVHAKPKYPNPFFSYAEVGMVLISQAYYSEDITDALKAAKVAIIFNEADSSLQADQFGLHAEFILAVSISEYNMYKLQLVRVPKSFILPFGAESGRLLAQKDLRPTIQMLLFSYRASSRLQMFINTYEDRRTFLVDSAYGCTRDQLLSYVFSSPQDD